MVFLLQCGDRHWRDNEAFCSTDTSGQQDVDLTSPYITPQGYTVLESELRRLWERRAEVTAALAAAAAEGDRSENAEYIYRKKELRELDRRIRYLQKRLPGLKVVREVGGEERVYFGAWVKLEREDGSVVEYRIVGSDESDASKGCISVDSPMARALMGKRRDEQISLHLATGPESFVVLAIRYGNQSRASGSPLPSERP
jgi:transcription elongation factor GreB